MCKVTFLCMKSNFLRVSSFLRTKILEQLLARARRTRLQRRLRAAERLARARVGRGAQLAALGAAGVRDQRTTQLRPPRLQR